MARFKYRMQNILDIKIKLETQAKNEFAQAQLRLNEELAQKQQLEQRRNAYEEEAAALRGEILNIRELNENRNAIETMKYMIERQEVECRRAQKEVDKKRAALNEVIKERKMHEKLREKAFEEYLEEEKQAETKSIDEVTSYNFGKKNK